MAQNYVVNGGGCYEKVSTLNVDEERVESIDKIDRCRHVEWKCGERLLFYFNPFTTICSAVIIWGFVIYCILNPTSSNDVLGEGKEWITTVWTWLYVGTQDVWALFIIVLYFSKYANLKLGGDDEKPEYSDASYFTMLFSCGIGIGLFYYGVAEPIYHYRGQKNRYWGRHTDNVQAQDAMNLTFFHWGIHGWIVYCIIGLLLGFLSYRRNLPLTMRTIFFPILGDKIFGILGDLIDTLCIVCTMFGVCTSLGLGVMQLNAGLQSVNSSIPAGTNTQLVIIWSITAMATLSVVSGIKVGIRRLSEVCFGIGCLLLSIILFADETWYILNLFVQSTGYYVQWVIQLGFHTDAFAQLGIAPDGNESPSWMHGWTIFYWGWWISWSPFVGMFIAKISRGRTIREFIIYTLTLPVVYGFFWFSVFGGSAIRMQNRAENMNMTCAETYNKNNSYDTSKYTSLALSVFAQYGTTRLECLGSTEMWFVFIRSYGDIEMLLAIVSIIAIVLYFVTSSDSGSLVIDSISANGFKEPPVIQRIFWALTEGATATALLVAGGEDSLRALQSVSVICGLPFTFVLNWTCVSMWRAVREEAGEIGILEGRWNSSVWDWDSWRKLKTTLVSIPCPWITLTQVRMKLEGNTGRCNYFLSSLLYGLPFYLWIILMGVSVNVRGLEYVAWSVLIVFFAFASGLRGEIREKNNIEGNMIEDFFSCVLLYPLVCMQVSEQVLYACEYKKNDNVQINENGIEMEKRVKMTNGVDGTTLNV